MDDVRSISRRALLFGRLPAGPLPAAFRPPWAKPEPEFLAACTVSFNGFAYPPAKGLEGAAYFRKAYEDPTIGFIAAQVGAHIGDWANFTKSSAAS